MSDTLRDLLRQDVDNVEIPTLDANDVIVQGEQRVHRRRRTVVLAAVTAVAAIAVGSVLVTRANPSTQGPQPVAPPSSAKSSDGAVDPHGSRPLVYADGSTVHVGDKAIEARDPVAFIDATDDGAVYEAALDGTLWFTDGSTTSVIGTSEFTAAPTAHVGVVTTGDSGSLVVWGDMTDRKNKAPVEFVVYDTSRREEVARIPFTEPGRYDSVLYVDEDQVWFTPDTWPPDCWFRSSRRCGDPYLFRFDVASGETTNVRMSELDAELSTRARMFVAGDSDAELVFREPGFSDRASFRQVGSRLVTVSELGDPPTFTRTNGDEVRLRLPNGYTAPGLQWDGSVIRMTQWLDDDHIVVWANEGGGDLPPQHGDLLVCRLPDGVCSVAVPRSSRPYVAP
jgi:hypothetical protein